MAIIQCFYKLFQSFISNFELIISQKDDELANLKAKIKSLFLLRQKWVGVLRIWGMSRH